MDWHKFFYYDPTVWTIENALHKLGKSSKRKWPLNDPEELRVSRVLDFENAFDVKYQTKATREFSCCQGLDVTAWGMFINGTGLYVAIFMIHEQARLDLKANSLQMMPKLKSAFTIDVRFDNGWKSSTPICLEDFTQKSSSNAGRSLYLRYNSFVDIVIVERDEVLRLILEYRQEDDGRRLFKLRSKFVFTNFTDVVLNALTLAMDHKENSTREEVEAYSICKKARSLVSSESTKNWYGLQSYVFFFVANFLSLQLG